MYYDFQIWSQCGEVGVYQETPWVSKSKWTDPDSWGLIFITLPIMHFSAVCDNLDWNVNSLFIFCLGLDWWGGTGYLWSGQNYPGIWGNEKRGGEEKMGQGGRHHEHSQNGWFICQTCYCL